LQQLSTPSGDATAEHLQSVDELPSVEQRALDASALQLRVQQLSEQRHTAEVALSELQREGILLSMSDGKDAIEASGEALIILLLLLRTPPSVVMGYL